MHHDALSEAQLLDGLGTLCLGQRILLYEQADSTNSLARSLAAAGEPEGTAVIAEEQTAGRGRLGRTWLAPGGTALLLSVIFRPCLMPERIQALTMMTALALRDALLISTALRAEVKWPNDVLLSGRKAAGILTEARIRGASIEFAIVGIGLNVNQQQGALPVPDATSVALELGHPVPRVPLLQTILGCLDLRYQRLQAGQSPTAEWAAALVTLGQRVQVVCGERTYLGLAESVDDSGALLLRLDDGQLFRAPAGDVHTAPA